jgi:hypothetical protein
MGSTNSPLYLLATIAKRFAAMGSLLGLDESGFSINAITLRTESSRLKAKNRHEELRG